MLYLDRMCVRRPQLGKVSMAGSGVRIPFVQAEVKQFE